MIVKDEKEVITRAFDSVKDFVDLYIICDTGSTDGTQEIIKDYFSKNGLEGEVHEKPWVNFSHNRQEAFDLAKGRCDYIMTLDADEVFAPLVDNEPVLTKKIHALPTLTADRVEVKTYYGSLIYHRAQFYKEGLDWKWRWPVHEVCGSIFEKSMQLLKDACIYPSPDGNRATDSSRFSRDALLFEEWLIDHPTDARAWFYLAQSYSDSLQPRKSLEPLRKCLEFSNWDEESYIAALRLGRYKLQAGEPMGTVMDHFWEAYNRRPHRAEPLYDLLAYFRSNGKFWSGVVVGETALKIPYPSHDRLFIESSVYTWKVKDDLAVCYYYVGRHQEALDLNLEISNNPNIGLGDLERIKKNIKECKEKLNGEG